MEQNENRVKPILSHLTKEYRDSYFFYNTLRIERNIVIPITEAIFYPVHDQINQIIFKNSLFDEIKKLVNRQ